MPKTASFNSLCKKFIDQNKQNYIDNFNQQPSYDSDDEMTDLTRHHKQKPMLPPKKFLQNQISVHTIFQRYTITGLDKSPFVHAENCGHCLSQYRWMLDINPIVLLSNGEWNYENGINDPETELINLVEGSHPISMIYNEKIEQLINGTFS